MRHLLRFWCLLVCLGSLSPLLAQKDLKLKFDANSTLGFSTSRGSYLVVNVKKPKDLERTLQIYIGDFSAEVLSVPSYKITRLNSTSAIIPYLALSPGFKRSYLKKLWPTDKVENGFLIHKVIYPQETLWTVAQMYTGFGKNYTYIMKHSKLRSQAVHPGMTLRIPYDLLMSLLKEKQDSDLPDLKAPMQTQAIDEELDEVPVITNADPPENELAGVDESEVEEPLNPVPAPAPEWKRREKNQNDVKAQANQASIKQGSRSTSPEDAAEGVHQQLKDIAAAHEELRYGQDSKGRYAEYRLKKGEAIYSSVVVRFCGLIRAQDVNDMAQELIKRNEIKDVTDMAIGASIRIPYEVLEPEYKATDDPDYIAFIGNLEAVAAVSSNVASLNLEGVTIILDAGHGGRDPGADRKRVWEDDFVYDILCRIKRRLESESNAKVITTIIDPSSEYTVMDVTMFRRDTDEVLNTTPPYRLSNARATTDGVNLRWMFANHHFQNLVGDGADPDKVLFASFHADALHHSIRGSMVYVPDARHVPAQVEAPGNLSMYKEASGNSFSNTQKEQQRAQARSTQFANNYVKASRDSDIRVHSEKPIRSLIIRDPRHPFVPAILRFNRVPARVLVEICNISNPNDQNLLKRPDFREKVADAFVSAVLRTYGNSDRAALSQVNARQDSRGD